MSARPTKTTNRIHFGDLDPRRFEDLCLALLYSLRSWTDIRHYGRLGGDGGIDILASEGLENGVQRTWYLQSRRYEKAGAADLKAAVRDSLAKADHPPDVLLVVVSCDVTRRAHEAFERYAIGRGIGQPILWTQSILEVKLYAERRDLLFSYFGISMATESRSRESAVKRNIALKKRLQRELLKTNIDDPQSIAHRPYRRFEYSEAIIHSVDDQSYPTVDTRGSGISGWFRLELFDFYHNGIEFILRIEEAVVTANGRWAPLPYDVSPAPTELSAARCSVIRVFHLGCIPFRNIVEFETSGDEYYGGLHLYCTFSDGGEPYEERRYRLCADDEYPALMPPELRSELRDILPGGRLIG